MTPSDREDLRVAFLVLEELDRPGNPDNIAGSHASAIHGVPRQTHDVDLVMDLRKDCISDLVKALRSDVPPERCRDPIGV
jgi:hypothetical protein